MKEPEELRQWCRDNWNQVHEIVRKDCVDHLDGWITKETILEWKATGYDGPGFHFWGGGMQIRNRLREVLLDEELPGVEYEGCPDLMKNWDDYYTGALDELLERYS